MDVLQKRLPSATRLASTRVKFIAAQSSLTLSNHFFLGLVASLPALGPRAPQPAERERSLESIFLILKISPQPVGGPQKEKKSGGTCPVCPLVKTAVYKSSSCTRSLSTSKQCNMWKSFSWHTTYMTKICWPSDSQEFNDIFVYIQCLHCVHIPLSVSSRDPENLS